MTQKSRFKWMFAFAAAFALSNAANASVTTKTFLKNRVSKTEAVQVGTGRWNSNFAVCKAYCESLGVPLIAVWSNGDSCGRCIAFQDAAHQSSFRTWMKSSGIVFWFGEPTTAPTYPIGSAAFQWTRGETGRTSYTKGGPETIYPFVRIYWPKGGVDVCTTGDTTRGGGGIDTSASVTNMKTYFNNALKVGKTGGWDPTLVPSVASGFSPLMRRDGNSRMELETGLTSRFDVSLIRYGVDSQSAATEYLTVAGNGAEPLAIAVEWEAGETEKTVCVPIDKDGTGDVTLWSINADDASKTDTITIPRVPAQPNAVSNPLWLDERTADTLAAGEWTMDLDVALERTKAQDGEAWTLVCYVGALWCPWSRGLEEYVFKTDEFKAFAETHNIALVCLDNPRRFSAADWYSGSVDPKSVSAGPYGAAPTLLRPDEGASGRSTASGLSYMARHMVSTEEAEAVLQRNHDLGYFGGKYATPDAYRTGHPTLVLLDKEGNVAGRFRYQYDSRWDAEARYTFDLDENIVRLAALVWNASVARERDRYATTTQKSVEIGESMTAELDVNVSNQTYLFSGVAEGYVEFSASPGFDGALTIYRLDPVTVVRRDRSLNVVDTVEDTPMPVTVATSVADSETGVVSVKFPFRPGDADGTRYALEVAAFTNASTVVYGGENLHTAVTVSSRELPAVYGTLTFDARKGAFANSEDATLTVMVGTGVDAASFPTPEWEGREFFGWWTAPDGGVQVTQIDKFTGDTTLYARYGATVTLNANGGKFRLYYDWDGRIYAGGFALWGWEGGDLESVDAVPISVMTGASLWELPKPDDRPGDSVFLGWFTADGTPASETLVPEGGLEFFAKWGGERVTFDANGGAFVDGWEWDDVRGMDVPLNEEPQNSIVRAAGDEVGWAPVPDLNPPDRIFAGWFTADGTQIDEWSVVPEGGIVCYARWDAVPTPAITPGDGAVFRIDERTGECVEVSISCDFEGAEIYYTIDGSTPRIGRAECMYCGPFWLYGSATVKAVAVVGEAKSELVTASITVKPLSLAAAVGASDLVFTTGGNNDYLMGWEIADDETTGTGYSARGGTPGLTDAMAWMETTVEGAGTFSFRWRVACEHDWSGEATWDHAAVFTNGVEVARIDGVTAWEEVSFAFGDAGTHTVRWEFTLDAYENYEGYEDAAWVCDVEWTPDAAGGGAPADLTVDVGDGKTVAVSAAWLAEHENIVRNNGGDAAAALLATAANGRKVWECYVLGLDPEAADDFRITAFPLKADGTPDVAGIVFDPPQEKWNVPGARAVVKGAASLDGPWTEVVEGEDGSAGEGAEEGGGRGATALPARFFKVEVVLP